jgi:hypothetical protein
LKTTVFVFSTLLFLAGCATSFTGNAHITKPYCQNFCKTNGLNFTGMVALGEYSSGCICSASAHGTAANEAAGSAAAAVGVVTQMRNAQAAAAAAHH